MLSNPQSSFRILVVFTTLLLGACDLIPEWLIFEPEAPLLPGERISVLSLQSELIPDPLIQDVEIRLPRPRVNAAWPQAGGVPSHAMQHLKMADAPQVAWRRSVGRGSEEYRRLLTAPVATAERVFTIDSHANVAAVESATGRPVWRAALRPKEEDYGAIGGGLAYDQGVLYITTGFGEVVALIAENGRLLWRVNLGVPFRAPPTISDGRVFAINMENKLYALSSDDGHRLWQHEGLPENSGLMGAANAAVSGGIVIAPYSSGEIYALRTDNGRVVWSDLLTRTGAAASLTTFSNISGGPVIAGDQVYAISNAGRMAAINLRTGARTWDQVLGGTQTPWVAGEFIYLVTNDAELVCLWRRDGRIRWVLPLQRYKNDNTREEPIQWNGPVLASDRLVIVSSHGHALAVSPYTGEVLGTIRLPEGAFIAPIIADRSLYILTDSAELFAIR
jgi:outer membrane protein assembly factor BamB